MRSTAAEKLETIRCARCRASYDDSAWETLRLVERVDAREIARSVLKWPADERVEVRECAHCGKAVSARRAAKTAKPVRF
jgi:hypothetical protein